MRHAIELRLEGGFRRRVEENVIGRFLACGDPQHGFARIYCDHCRHACILAFSCKARYFCPSCHQKRVLAYGEWVEANVLAPDTLAEKMLSWRHTGFSVHSAVRIHARDADGRRRLAQLCRHIPDRFEHLVRYAGWYSNRTRGRRRCMEAQPAEVAMREIDVRQAARVRSTWARLINKVYEVDPLECPKCKGPMRVIALIEDKAVIRRILTHLGLWATQVSAGKGPGPPSPDPPEASAPILTYHPVPDIA